MESVHFVHPLHEQSETKVKLFGTDELQHA